jgi:hypothetical protein
MVSATAPRRATAALLLLLLAGVASGEEPAPRADDPLLLPQATAADLLSGAADHIVRAAFLGRGAPGAMLVRGVLGYAAGADTRPLFSST